MSLQWLIYANRRFLKLRDYGSDSRTRIVGMVIDEGDYWAAYLLWNSRRRIPLGGSRVEVTAREIVVRRVQHEVYADSKLSVLKDSRWSGKMRTDGIPRLEGK